MHLTALTKALTTGRIRIGHAADGSRQAGNLRTINSDATGLFQAARKLRRRPARYQPLHAQDRSPDADTFPAARATSKASVETRFKPSMMFVRDHRPIFRVGPSRRTCSQNLVLAELEQARTHFV